ncbi:DUF3618 domain-containing protein [Streptosporangium sp. KLBMP 9127]|nr:DUF3618 domain-containing protein [Streptosporangium sp. KLBMP 9127]
MADTDPDELERRIESTRADLARTVDAIADRVSPKRVVQRGVARAKANAEHLVAMVGDKVGDLVEDVSGDRPGAGVDGPGTAAFGAQPDDLWEERDPMRDLAPVLIGVGAVLVVGAAVLLWRRRRR